MERDDAAESSGRSFRICLSSVGADGVRIRKSSNASFVEFNILAALSG